ncbi:glycosyltransferase family 8 protein [Methylorubrum sp. SB2]|uniref:glycosyltransferase family 8 protein n=1 Tax=Methylorubrum subtropicum TaxID=3138812 RepID=UPI00313D38CD
MTDRPICLLLCIDAAYLRQAGITLASILESNPGKPIDVTLVGSGLTPAQVDSVFAPLGARHPALRLHFREMDPAALPDLPVTRQFSSSIYTRILLDRFIDRSHERVLYLDADTVVSADLTPLWNADLNGAVLGAVRDPFRLDLDAIGFAPDEPYFNSGVLLIDMERWRALDCEARVLDVLVREAHRLPWMDQDALNLALRGQVHFLSPRWNFQPRCADVPAGFLGLSEAEYAALRANPSIVHYTTSHKPWNAGFRVHYSRAFFSVARRAGLGMAPARPRTLSDRLLQAKTWLRWHFPGPFRTLRRIAKPEAAALMYGARAGR